MTVDFQEFLRQKTAGSDIRERNRNRMEWLGELNRLFDQLRDWLRASDPENLLEAQMYEVRRAESRLGVYDAPALRIRLNTDEVDVLPIGRFSIGPLSAETKKALNAIMGNEGPAAGRVDITNGDRRYMLFRDVKTEPERWFAVHNRSEARLLDRASLEAILQDLWS